jgi:hypothetical protein
MEYLFVTVGDIDLLCRVLGQEVKFGRDVVRIAYPHHSGKEMVAILFVDRIDLMVVIPESDAKKRWSNLLGGKKPSPDSAVKGQNINPFSPEYCADEACIEPADESGYCDAHKPAKESA